MKERIPSYAYFQGFPNFLGTPDLWSAALRLLLGKVYLEYLEAYVKLAQGARTPCNTPQLPCGA